MTTATMSAPAKIDDRKIDGREIALRVVLVLMLALSCVSFIEPSPYELFFFLLIPVALFSGLTVTRTSFFIISLMVLATLAELLAVMPHLDAPPSVDEMRPAVFSIYTVYLWGSAILFTMVFSRHTEARVSLALKAYGFSCVFAGIWGFLSYMNVNGLNEREIIDGRVAGPFKDPNVLGSYCILGVIFFTHAAMVGRHRFVSFVGLLISLFGGVFLSFSRGSWGATVIAIFIMMASMYWTGEPLVRRRIRHAIAAMILIVGVAGVVTASNDTLRDTVAVRAKVEQDYDSGTTGRFGNQLRSIPMLMERPLGFGPHRFGVLFGLDPHNSYIGAFSSGGWAGGCIFLILVLSSIFVALRLTFVSSRYRPYAQVVGPALICLLLQAFQIDIDHWRFFFLMLGMIWGMEVARLRDIGVRPAEHASPDALPATV